MSIDEIRKINQEWKDELLYDTSFWHYEPFSDGYWNEHYKIVLCNTEAYGDSRENSVLTLDKFKERIINNGKGSPTLVRSALLLYCLYQKLHGVTVSEEKLFELLSNYDEMINGIQNTMYMNLRKEENITGNSKEDEDGIRRSLIPEEKYSNDEKEYIRINRNFTLDFIKELEADIFIITGETGWDVLRRIYKGEIDLFNNLKQWNMYKEGKTLYVSMYHPSPIYGNSDSKYIKYILKTVEEIYDRLRE
jgi:hypothetical protein